MCKYYPDEEVAFVGTEETNGRIPKGFVIKFKIDLTWGLFSISSVVQEDHLHDGATVWQDP